MATVGFIQRQIKQIEGFDVKFKDRRTLRDVNDKKKGIPSYPYQNALRNSCTVSHWKNLRFKTNYSGFAVDIICADGSAASGMEHLGTVRDTFLD